MGEQAIARDSLATVFMRHVAIAVLAAAAFLFLARSVPLTDQPLSWLLAALLVGLVVGLLDRGSLGAIFLLAGLGIGLTLEMHWRLGTMTAVIEDLASKGLLYAGVVVAVGLAYTAGGLLRSVRE